MKMSHQEREEMRGRVIRMFLDGMHDLNHIACEVGLRRETVRSYLTVERLYGKSIRSRHACDWSATDLAKLRNFRHRGIGELVTMFHGRSMQQVKDKLAEMAPTWDAEDAMAWRNQYTSTKPVRLPALKCMEN